MQNKLIDKIRAALKRSRGICAGATEGPWERHVYQSGSVSVATAGKQWFDICHVKQMNPDDKMNWSDDETTDAEVQRLANALHVAHARQAFPAALDAAEIAVEVLEDIRRKSMSPMLCGALTAALAKIAARLERENGDANAK